MVLGFPESGDVHGSKAVYHDRVIVPTGGISSRATILALAEQAKARRPTGAIHSASSDNRNAGRAASSLMDAYDTVAGFGVREVGAASGDREAGTAEAVDLGTERFVRPLV